MGRDLFTERFDSRVQTVYTLGITLCVLAAALLLQLLERRGRPAFGLHLTFALHYLALLFLLSVVGGVAIRQFGVPYAVSVGGVYSALAAWLFFALRRVHGDPLPWTLLVTTALLGLSWALFDLIGAGAISVTLRLA